MNIGVPQGLVLGTILFASFVAPISQLISNYGIGYHKYADDTQLYAALLASPQTALNQLKMCSSDLQLWFWRKDLLLNPDKSEVAFFGTKQELQRTHLLSKVCLAGYRVAVSNT